MVKVTVSGNCVVKSIHIDQELLDGDKKVLQQFIIAATNAAIQKAQENQFDPSNLQMPEGFKFPF